MKIIKRALVLLFVVGGVISCSEDDSIPELLKQNVILASGFVWDSGKIVTVNPFDGKEISPCITKDNLNLSATKQGQKPKTGDGREVKICNTQIVSADDSLKNALKISELPIIGTIKVNGEEKPAKFVVTVTALYTGSHCATIYSGGQELTNCINREAYCEKLKKYGKTC